MHASQLHLFEHFAEFRLYLFQKKLHIDPLVFDEILDQISGCPIFHSNSNHPQLPVIVQLMIFLNRVGHYGNTMTPEDMAQWAGVSVRSVINCTNQVMITILDQHNDFIYIPGAESEAIELAHMFTEAKMCVDWQEGVFAANGSMFNFFKKLALYRDTFTDRKGNYSLNFQVKENILC